MATLQRLASQQVPALSLASMQLFTASVQQRCASVRGMTAPQALEFSHRFLAQQVPVRAARMALALPKHASAVEVGGEAMQEGIKRLEARYCDLATLCADADKAGQCAFKSWLTDQISGLEQDLAFAVEVTRATVAASANGTEASCSQYPHAQGLTMLADSLMNATHLHLITSRMLAAQHNFLFTLCEQEERSSTGQSCVGSPLLDRAGNPSSISESEEPQAQPVVNPRCDVLQLIADAVDDCRAFCVEKHGEAPEVRVSKGAKSLARAVVVEGHMHFILIELLKNAMHAMLRHHASDMMEDHAIQVWVSSRGAELGVKISDTGGGIAPQHRARATSFFATTHVEVQGEPNYTYSKNFGAKFSGYGVGLPMARLYARVAGGDVGISCLPGHGTDATLIINRLGTSSIPLG